MMMHELLSTTTAIDVDEATSLQQNVEDSAGDNAHVDAPIVKFVPDAPVELTPVVDQQFSCEEDAYKIYNTYAKCCGFSVRTSQTRKRKNGDIFYSVLRCLKEGS